MKDYPKKYEDVLTAERTLKRCKISKITTDNGITWKEYADSGIVLFSKFQEDTFDYWVKMYWLFRRFNYFGKGHRYVNKPNCPTVDIAFNIFFKTKVGWDYKIITKNYAFKQVSSYFDDFFPDLDGANDVLCRKFKIPYKYMNMCCLMLVYLMPERLELLERGEKEMMDLAKFTDYIINYISCYNDDYGVSRYALNWNRFNTPYVMVKK